MADEPKTAETATPDPLDFHPADQIAEAADQLASSGARALEGSSFQQEQLSHLAIQHGQDITQSFWDSVTAFWQEAVELAPKMMTPDGAMQSAAYLTDSAQRGLLFLDTLRERGNSYVEREAEGFKPVLVFDYDLVADGRTFERPVNYALVRIKPPAGAPPQREDGRPFVIIDPRAGHGSGIGGYKSDSEVGVALMDGHPVYFVIFFPEPEPGQTLADVCAAEAAFLAEVLRRHPDAPKPLVTGNCQGGWAAMLLAATNPHLPGPLVIAGAPLSYWAGTSGRNPLRYFGGLMGGVVPALLASDLGAGRFDGANLVMNFETLNPGNTWWRKYYALFADVDKEAARFLEFERWWSGFYFMNEAEIRWIVETLFIGNKLTQGTAVLDDGRPVDLRRIKSPIVVFASHGDNITPPEQALFWIADLYKTTAEIRAHSQVIIYTLHESVGHLGIFVSSSVARKQHKQITSTVKTIEALAPGLYEMTIVEAPDRPHVAFEAREISDLLALGDNREEEVEFASVARLSELGSEIYEITLRPLVKSLATPASAQALRQAHPMRQQRYLLSDLNPFLAAVAPLSSEVRRQRDGEAIEEAKANPFRRLEELQAGLIEASWNLFRDSRDAAYELAFHSLYGQPGVTALAKEPRVIPGLHDLRQLPAVRRAIEEAAQGGYGEGVIRMLILMAKARGSVRRSRLERSNAILQSAAPFAEMTTEERSRIIHEQSLIVEFAPEEAITTLPRLLPKKAERQQALDLVLEIAGPLEEMSPPTLAMLKQLQNLLETKATGWHAPSYEVMPFGGERNNPAAAE
ncbi:MAG: DUF3141 domain-containing protein [Pseudomonadota bacterium]